MTKRLQRGAWTTLGLAALLLPHLAGAAAAGDATIRIPQVHATSFAGQPVTLPEMLRGHAGVLVVGFSQGSRTAVEAWGRRLAADYRGAPDVSYYEMPMLAGVPHLLRNFVLGKIKGSVPQPSWPTFVPLLEDEAAWRAAAHYTGGDDAYVMLVDDQGVVRWQSHDAAADAAYARLRQQVESLRSSTGHAPR
ncbi:MAG: hypothetical protein KGK08_11820 [Acidobacteriota bacterium]|nr:hypothetical protein [Acidobacteriota bacterium]